MNKIITVVIVVVVIIGGYLLFSSNATPTEDQVTEEINEEVNEEGSEVGRFDKIPEFTLADYKGNQVSTNDFPGKILVVNSWAAWCPFCVDELPAFGELQEKFPDDVVVIAVNRQESLKKAQGYTDDAGISDSYVFLLDPDDSFYRSIGGFSMPETIFVDTEGNIRVHKRGPMKLDEMVEKIEDILNS